MGLDSPSRIVNIGLRAKRRNSRKTSFPEDFQIRILNNACYKFTLIALVTTKHRYRPR
jgi:hypothetical protein